MGNALNYLRELFKKIGLKLDRKTAASLAILLLLLISLPIGLLLIKSRLIFAPRAAGELIQLDEGGCIKLNKDKKKVVDCSLVPLKLINPFYAVSSIRPSSSPNGSQSENSPQPSVSGSPVTSNPGTPQSINVRSYNNNIQAALDAIKFSGGSVYLPSGTYLINEKVRVYSNTTLFGDGMGATIIKFNENIPADDMMANDSTSGQQNIVIRDLTLQGPDIPRITDCCHGLKLENITNAYVINVEVNDVGMDGIYLGYKNKNGIPIGVTDVRVSGCKVNRAQRQQIGLITGSNVVIDGCVIDGTNRHGQQVYVGIDVEPDDVIGPVIGAYIIGNSVSNTNVGIALNGTGGESKSAAAVRDSKVCGNSVHAISVQVADTGSNNQISDSTCAMPASLANLPAAPAKPAAKRESFFASIFGNITGTVFAQDTGDDNFTGTSGDDSNDIFTSGSSSPVPNSPSSPNGSVLRYRLAESQAGLNSATWSEFALLPSQRFAITNIIPQIVTPVSAQSSSSASMQPGPVSSGNATFSVGKEFILTNFQLKDTKPGTKQIWVQYMHPDGSTRVDDVTFDLVDKTPQILGLACNLDITKENLKVTIDGNYFGNAIGTASVVTPNTNLEVLGWNNTQVSALLKKPNIPINEGQRFKIKVTRPDGFESGTAVCAVDKTLVSLGARIFCREPGKFDASDVAVTLLTNVEEAGKNSKLSKVEEKVTINSDGEIQNLKTQLQVGKNYAIAIKAPGSLRRSALFTALEGTTEIVSPDGSPFILPVGDIAPKISLDGQINTLDRAELIRQWRTLGQGETKQTGDFNRDSKVNSIDWACMQYDFGSSDDPIPVEVPGSASDTMHIPDAASDTLFIPVTSPKPSSSPISSLLHMAEFLLIS